MDESGLNCMDKNECILGHTCHNDATCTNTDGSFTCSCKIGYEGDGQTCRAKNECSGRVENVTYRFLAFFSTLCSDQSVCPRNSMCQDRAPDYRDTFDGSIVRVGFRFHTYFL